MSNQERYDELDNFLSTLLFLRDELNSKDLRDEINNLLYSCGYDDEKNELEKILIKEQEQEEKELERGYREVQGF